MGDTVYRPHFLHCQLIDAVNAHVHVLEDSLSLIRQLEALSFGRCRLISRPRLTGSAR
jgi:hypothetical protein